MTNLPFSLDEYLTRQSRLHSQLPEKTIVIIPTNPYHTRSNDTNYPFRGNSYMLYVAGWYKPNAIFVSSNVTGHWKTSLFVEPNDIISEVWEGRRIGIENAKLSWPIDETYSILDMDKIIGNKLKEHTNVYHIQGLNHELDKLVMKSLTDKSRSRNLKGVGPRNLSDPSYILDEMRLIKSSEEIVVMKKSAKLASEAHIKAIAESNSNMGEWEIQSIIEGHFISRRSEISYGSIVGGGANGTILHYNSNNEIIKGGDLVLVDAGCEIHGYASDITRTWPVNGKFSIQQKEIYELVLSAELAGIEACQVGNPWKSSHYAASEVIAAGLIKLGVLDCTLQEALGDNYDGPYRNYFMHGTSHSLGLDVHDVGIISPHGEEHGRLLEPGMVLTVEPGIYFPNWRTDIDIPSKYAGIGIRIEDDVLITEDGPLILTSDCPKDILSIESLMN